MPCFGNDYRSSSDFIRASQTAIGGDKSSVMRIANLRAREALAQNLQSVIEFATEEYLVNFTGNTSQHTKSKFRDYALNYGSVALSLVNVICEEMYEKNDGSFEFFIAIEVDTDTFIRNFDQGIRNEEIDLEFDRQQFRQIYERKIEEFNNRYY